jgi:hypothetical protein
VCTTDKVCDSLVPTGRNGTCYRGGLTVFENHQMCNVTSKLAELFGYLLDRPASDVYLYADRKILEQLKDQIPQVTFSCNKNHNDCDFQCKMSVKSMIFHATSHSILYHSLG